MKKTIILLILIISTINIYSAQTNNYSVYQKNSFQILEKNTEYIPFQITDISETNEYWGAFWTNFLIAAVGTYFIYGVAAGIVSVGITYFIVNGNKKAMKMAIWGAILGTLLGAGIRILTLI